MGVIILSASPSHTDELHLHNEEGSDFEQEESAGLALSSMESSPAEEREELPHQMNSHSLLFSSSSGIHYGTRDELTSLLNEFDCYTTVTLRLEKNHIRLMFPINPNCCLDHAYQHRIVLYKEGSVLKHHPGTDGRETQWENEVLPNYRLV